MSIFNANSGFNLLSVNFEHAINVISDRYRVNKIEIYSIEMYMAMLLTNYPTLQSVNLSNNLAD